MSRLSTTSEMRTPSAEAGPGFVRADGRHGVRVHARACRCGVSAAADVREVMRWLT